MDRHTESFICLSLFVILLQNTARSEGCSHSYNDAPGIISDIFTSNQPTYTCRYHVYAPDGHYIKLNITGLLGQPIVEEQCLPRLVIKNIGQLGGIMSNYKICNQGDIPLPHVVQSTDSELKIVFRGHDRQISSFNATFTFHRNTATGPSAECLACARATKQHATPLAAASNASVMSTTSVIHDNRHRTEPPKPDSPTNVEHHMELFVLIILAPVTLVCICCVIMYYRRRTTTPHQQNQRLPSETSSPPASQAPLLSSHSHNFSSSVSHQDALRQQRETICRRSESTEKFPSSVVLLDDDEPPGMRSNIMLNRDFRRENGIRPSPNRTVFDIGIYENMLIEEHNSSRQQHQQHHHHSPRASPQMSVPRNRELLRTDSARSGALVDSVTKSPLQFGDSDSEGPPPYNICVTSIASNSRIANVCDPQHFVSNSAAAASAGHQVRHHGRGAHPQHANGRHPPVPLSPHFELDVDQGQQQQLQLQQQQKQQQKQQQQQNQQQNQQQQQQNMAAVGTVLENRLSSLDRRQHERSDHETTDVL